MTPRDELLKAASFFAEAVEEYGDDEAEDSEFCAILRDWMRDQADQHVHLAHLDSGYDEVSLWDHVSMTAEIAAIQPSVRMARLVNKINDESSPAPNRCICDRDDIYAALMGAGEAYIGPCPAHPEEDEEDDTEGAAHRGL
jgi:hypothetical protein